MNDALAVTVVGNDRLGIVAGVTRSLYELGCNLEDVTSTILRGHFAMVLIVRGPAGVDQQAVERRLASIAADLELSITARPVAEADASFHAPTHVVSVYGADRPGIVFRVAEALTGLDANITDLQSRIIGPDDDPVYAVMMEVVLPDESGAGDALDALRDELGVDVTIKPLDADLL